MKKIINGVEFNVFGSNIFSYGMALVSVYPMPENMPEKVLNGEFPGVYLNPSAPCKKCEFFGVFGTEEQYKRFYKRQKDCQISKQVINEFGGITNFYKADKEEINKIKKLVKSNYKDWWI